MTGKLEGRKEVLLTYAALDQVPHRKLERAVKGSKRKKRKNIEDASYFKNVSIISFTEMKAYY